MVIRHVSDTHGIFPESNKKFDLTVLSGDIFPNHRNVRRNTKAEEIYFQKEWIKNNQSFLIDWFEDKPCIYIHGNHDFTPEEYFGELTGAININNQFAIVKGIKFYGFPFIPWIVGEWAYETDDLLMLDKVAEMINRFNNEDYPDVLVTHSPPYGILDKGYDKAEKGNRRLTNGLMYYMTALPKYLLCGHVHESNGIVNMKAEWNLDLIVSNAATTVNYLSL